MPFKAIKVHSSVHDLLDEIIESGYKHKDAPQKKTSKASIVVELILKLHKKECK